MKIICDTQEEYNDLMQASRYLHDFMVETGCFRKRMVSLDQDKANGVVGYLCHIYLDGRDFPNKSEFVTVKEINNGG